VAWKQIKGGPAESTPVLVGDRLFMVTSGGIGTCLNTADGSIVWQERLGPDFAASPLAADGRLYFFDSWNKGYVVEAADTFKLLATNKTESGCMASPAVFGKAIILRTKTHLYRIEQ
jgi:outer membrane protein assembly factor BamB